MSEIKPGDKIYFQGNQGKVMRVISDENEPLLEVVLTQKRVAYLNPSQLDLYPFAEQLNNNQQKWINRLTINFSWYGGTAQHALHATLQEPEMPDLPQNEFAIVLEVFSRWVQEQEEE